MRLLMTADTIGGVWTYAIELARALAAHGVSVALATMGAPITSGQRAAARGVPGLDLFESDFKLEWMDEPWADVGRAGEWLLRLEERERPTVVHLNGYVHAALPWRAPTLVVAHSCVLSWWAAVKGEPAPPRYDRYRAAVARGLRAADLVVAPTAAMLAALACHHGPPTAALVVPNGRQTAGPAPGAKDEIILSAGRLWDEAKNVAALARVAPTLPWPILVAGEERHPSGATVPIGHLRPLGWLSAAEMDAWLARAAIFALPARYEPFGLSALEAALAGCALVLGDIASLREVWGDAALFVPPDDDAALAAALERLIREPDRRAALAARARRRAGRFTPERAAMAYRAAYTRLAAGTGRAATRRDHDYQPAFTGAAGR